MWETITVKAPAKLNLTLDVLSRRTDGYHDLKMIMQSVSLADRVTLAPGTGNGIRVRTNLSFLPNDRTNLAAKAAEAFFAASEIAPIPLDITLDKRIPVCAGTAGGSSDAAAVLRGLNRILNTGYAPAELAKIGESVGSDVPYCVLGCTALAEGRGEKLTVLPPLPHCAFVLCKPGFSISTPELFGAIDSVKLHCRPDTDGTLKALELGDLIGVCRRLYNVFEDALPAARRSTIEEIRGVLLEQGALASCMSGTGPTVYGIFPDPASAEAAAAVLKRSWQDTFACEAVQPEL